MKEIDYIYKNLDVKKFLKLIKKVGEGFLATETFKCVKNPNKKVNDGLEALVWNGVFFNKIKDLSLTYFARIESGDEEVDANFNIICFYSKTDKKYRLMTFDMSKGSFKYTLEEIFNNMPTKLEIENKFYDRMVQLNKANKLLFKKNIIDEEFEPRFIIMEGNQDFFKSLSEDDEKRYHTELSLERAK